MIHREPVLVAFARGVVAVFLAGVLASCLACTSAPDPPTRGDPSEAVPAGPYLFRDVTDESGVRAEYKNGEEAGLYAILQTLGGGIALFDYDGDGLLDLFIPGGGSFEGQEIRGRPNKLYRNLGDFRFRDVTHEVGVDRPIFYTHGCAAADYDRDGWPDLLVTGFGRLALYHNQPDGKGGRHFVEVAQKAGLTDDLWATSAAWGDLDGDGYPDLYVCHYVDWSLPGNNPHCVGFDHERRDICPPAHFNALPHRLYQNNGDGTFRDVSPSAGLRVDSTRKDFGKGLGVLLVDVNGDGKPEIYVANDTSGNYLYLNRSRGKTIRLEEMGFTSGAGRDQMGLPMGSMGVAVGDYDNCGRPSLWVTNYERELHALYHNDSKAGRVAFHFSSQAAGIAVLGQTYVGWGTGFVDLDRDGLEDLLFVNGHPNFHPHAGAHRQQKPVILHNKGGGHFEPITPRGGPYFQHEHNGRGVAFGDLDNDGRTDLVISNVNEPVALLRNEAVVTDRHWLGVELVGRKNRDVVGAKVTLEVDGRRQYRFAHGGGSYLSSCDRRHLFGLGEARRVGRVTVSWPGGREEHWDDLALDRYWRLVEGSGS